MGAKAPMLFKVVGASTHTFWQLWKENLSEYRNYSYFCHDFQHRRSIFIQKILIWESPEFNSTHGFKLPTRALQLSLARQQSLFSIKVLLLLTSFNGNKYFNCDKTYCIIVAIITELSLSGFTCKKGTKLETHKGRLLLLLFFLTFQTLLLTSFYGNFLKQIFQLW